MEILEVSEDGTVVNAEYDLSDFEMLLQSIDGHVATSQELLSGIGNLMLVVFALMLAFCFLWAAVGWWRR